MPVLQRWQDQGSSFLQFCKNITTARNPANTMASGEPTKSSPSGFHGGTWSRTQKNRFCPVTKIQLHEVKFRESMDAVITPEYSKESFGFVHLNFAELRKKGEGMNQTQALLFLHWLMHQNGGQKRREIFKTVKVIKSDNGPAFRIKKLEEWPRQRGIFLMVSAPYHPAANGLA